MLELRAQLNRIHIIKGRLLRVQEQSEAMCRGLSKLDGRPSWVNMVILTESEHKKEAHRDRSRERPMGGYRDIAWTCRDGVRKTKAHLESKLARGSGGQQERLPL